MIKGKLIIIGGAEDKGTREFKDHINGDPTVDGYYENGILARIVRESAHKEKSRIEILPTASTEPKESAQDYEDAFRRLGCDNIGVINISKRSEACDEEMVEKLRNADVLMVTGGDQMRLTSILGGTPFLDLLLEKYYHEDFIYAGSSAGAAGASNNMVFQGLSEVSLFKGKVRVTSGLGLINNAIIDTHFVTRGRIGRLLQIIVANPRLLGIGLEENAALLITEGNKMEAVGPGMTMIIDGRDIKDSNFNDIDDGEAISIENAVLHVMSKYDMYDLQTRKIKIDHGNDNDE